MRKKEIALTAIERLKERYPDAVCSLTYRDPLQLFIATRLSAQCTDARVNLVTPALFKRYPTLDAFAEADPEEVGEYIRSCGLYKTKARDIVAMARMLRSDFGGQVPDTVEELTKLPGVGRKTANLVCGDIYGKPAVVTDTHCIPVSPTVWAWWIPKLPIRWRWHRASHDRRRKATISVTGWYCSDGRYAALVPLCACRRPSAGPS